MQEAGQRSEPLLPAAHGAQCNTWRLQFRCAGETSGTRGRPGRWATPGALEMPNRGLVVLLNLLEAAHGEDRLGNLFGVQATLGVVQPEGLLEGLASLLGQRPQRFLGGARVA